MDKLLGGFKRLGIYCIAGWEVLLRGVDGFFFCVYGGVVGCVEVGFV